MTDRNSAPAAEDGKNLEELLRDDLISGFSEALVGNKMITDKQATEIQDLIRKGSIAPRDLLNALQSEGEVTWNE